MNGIMYPTEQERIWAAGFFDGEGCLQVSRTKHQGMRYGIYHRLVASVRNTHLPSLERLQTLYGGAIYEAPRLYSLGKKPCWDWRLNGRGPVGAFLRSIRLFSFTKREEVELGIEACQNWVDSTNDAVGLSQEALALREGYYLALREAKRGA